MKKRKRWLAIALVAAMVGGTLTGCGSKGSSKEGKKDEPVELSFYMMNGPVADQDRIMEKANKIIEEEIGATLKLVMVDSGQYAEKMNLMINSGDPWDLCFTASWGGINFYENAQKGAYADLTELLPKYAPETYSRIPEGLWEGVTVDGKIYASVNYQQYGAGSRNGFLFRSDLAEEVGFDVLSLKGKPTLEILQAAGDFMGQVKEKHPDMIGWETSATYNLFANSPLHWDMEEVGDVATPGWIRYDDPTKVINQFETEEFKEFCNIMRDWYNKGYVRKDGATVTDTSPDRKSGKFIVEQCTAWPDSVDFPESDVNRGMSMTTHDQAPATCISNTRTIIKAGAGPNAAVAVNAQSKNKEKAVELIELLNTNDELYMLLSNGEEGVDYTWDEEDNVKLIDGKYNFNYNEWQIGQSYSPDFTRALYPNGEKGEIKKNEQQYIYDADKEAEVSPLTGFVFDPTDVKTQIANCSAVITEMVPGLASGSIDPTTELPRFLERLEDAGVNDIIAQKQAQLDEFNANK